jgi:hypothetical protein
MVLLAGALLFVGVKKVKRIKAPTQTIETTKETVSVLKNATSRQ